MTENVESQPDSVTLWQGDCIELMKKIPDESVDLILADLPYKETGNSWDKDFLLGEACKEFSRMVKEDGAIVLTGTFRFGVQLFNHMPHLYKYDWVWEKDNGTNAPNVRYQPFRIHENIYVFGKGRVTHGTRVPMKYFPQKTEGKPYCQKSGRSSVNWRGGLKNTVTDNKDGKRHPKTIQKFVRDKSGLHPTQKPVALLEFLVKTYTKAGDLVLDSCMGSGSTGVACVNTGRRFIGMELDEQYFDVAQSRIHEAVARVKAEGSA